MATQQPLLMRDDGSVGGSPVCVVDPAYGGNCVWYLDTPTAGLFFSTPAAHQIRQQIIGSVSSSYYGAYLPVVSSGKCYVEFSIIGSGFNSTGQNYQIGVVSASYVANSNVNNSANPSFFVNNIGTPGYIVNGGGYVNNAAYAFTQGDVICMAIDHGTGNCWVRKNGGAWISGDPVAGTSPTATLNAGAVYIAVSNYKGLTNPADFNIAVAIQGDTFAYAIPTGYAAYAPILTTTTVLQHFDGNFADTSPIAAAISSVGSATTSAVQSVFGGKSYFGAASSAVYTPTNTNYTLRTLDSCVDMWIWRSAVPSGTETLYTIYDTVSAIQQGLRFPSSADLIVYSVGNSSLLTVTGFLTGYLSQWVHVALVRYQGTTYVYRNGIVVGSAADIATTTNSAAMVVGSQGTGGSSSWLGYIDEFRYTLGYAEYIPSLAKAAPSSSNDANWASVVLMLHFDGAQGSTTFTDSSPNGSSVAVTAGPTLDTRLAKFGSACYYNSGAAGYITATIGAAGVMAGDFTIDFWLGPAPANVVFYGNAGAYLYNDLFQGYGAASISCPFNTIVTWTHYAIVRASGVITTYKNFVAVASQAYAGSIDFSTIKIGTYVPNNNLFFSGYIDEFRVTAGVARTITQSFTPPSLPYCNGTSAGISNTGKAKLVGTPMVVATNGLNNPNPIKPLIGIPATAGAGSLNGQNSNVSINLAGCYMQMSMANIGPPIFDATFNGANMGTYNAKVTDTFVITFHSAGAVIGTFNGSSIFYNSVWVVGTANFPVATIAANYYIRVIVTSGSSTYLSYTAHANLSTDNAFTVTGLNAPITVQFNIVPVSPGGTYPTPVYPQGQYSVTMGPSV